MWGKEWDSLLSLFQTPYQWCHWEPMRAYNSTCQHPSSALSWLPLYMAAHMVLQHHIFTMPYSAAERQRYEDVAGGYSSDVNLPCLLRNEFLITVGKQSASGSMKAWERWLFLVKKKKKKKHYINHCNKWEQENCWKKTQVFSVSRFKSIQCCRV